MTLETMQAVTEELNKRGVPATFEYPGFISCQCSHGLTLTGGDANETFDIDVRDSDWKLIESLQSSIPSDSTDVQLITDHIAACTTATRPGPRGYRAEISMR